jgi:hypothetical protein
MFLACLTVLNAVRYRSALTLEDKQLTIMRPVRLAA